MNNHLINQNTTLLEALSVINKLAPEPLVLFVVNDESQMVGTLTDGDSRRSLLAGRSVSDKVGEIMHRDFNFMSIHNIHDVFEIQRQKRMQMKLVPILDDENHIVDVINLQKYKSRLPIDAVLMAGGKGERLRPLTEKTPKPLLPVGNKAIIDYNINSLISYGIKNISVTVNYLKEQLIDHFKNPISGIHVKTVCEPTFLGTIGSVQFVDRFENETVLIMNSDLFTNINIEDMFVHYMNNNADVSVAAIPYSISVPYGIFETEGREIKSIIEKPTYNYYANGGIYLIKKELLDKYITNGEHLDATDFIQRAIQDGRKIVRFPHSGYWIDIGNKQEYNKAIDFAKHIQQS